MRFYICYRPIHKKTTNLTIGMYRLYLDELYDMDDDADINKEFKYCNGDPTSILSEMYSTGIIDEDTVAGLQFKQIFKSDHRNCIIIPRLKGEIYSIYFDGKCLRPEIPQSKHTICLGDGSRNTARREISNDEVLYLLYRPLDQYYITDFSGSIVVTFIAYSEKCWKENTERHSSTSYCEFMRIPQDKFM